MAAGAAAVGGATVAGRTVGEVGKGAFGIVNKVTWQPPVPFGHSGPAGFCRSESPCRVSDAGCWLSLVLPAAVKLTMTWGTYSL